MLLFRITYIANVIAIAFYVPEFRSLCFISFGCSYSILKLNSKEKYQGSISTHIISSAQCLSIKDIYEKKFYSTIRRIVMMLFAPEISLGSSVFKSQPSIALLHRK